MNDKRQLGRSASGGRDNQRRRTRKHLLDAANRLTRQGDELTLENVAAAALVSRATVYRYFPNIEALLVEAALDLASPDAATLFDDGCLDARTRMQRLDAAFDAMIRENEAALRMMLVHSLRQSLATGGSTLPQRQNRRLPLIEAALQPLQDRLKPAERRLLAQALALLVGTESMLVCKDVLQLSDARARTVKSWAMDALLAHALRDT